MPRPTWDPTRPQDSEQVSSFPSLHRADKSTLKDILGTLGPFGATTTTWRQVQVGDDTWLVQNLYFDGTNWNRDDTTKASVAIGLRSNGTVTIHKVAAGANPVGASLPAPVATLDATSLVTALVAGADPGGTEVLRAQSLRARAGIFSDIYSNTVVVGTDPGGTEFLRAGSARLNAPVLLGSVPQFTMASDPTAALHVATKQYVDARGAGSQPPTMFAFTSSGTYTWTRPANCRRILIRCWGGGGAGGYHGADQSTPAGGGGGGGYAERLLDVTGISSATVVVGAGGSPAGGAGGASRFSVGATTYAEATGGTGGSGATPGSGGSGIIGDIRMFGARGAEGWRGGMGGGSPGGGTSSGAFPGAGGNGGWGTVGAGAGASGLVIVVEYY